MRAVAGKQRMVFVGGCGEGHHIRKGAAVRGTCSLSDLILSMSIIIDIIVSLQQAPSILVVCIRQAPLEVSDRVNDGHKNAKCLLQAG